MQCVRCEDTTKHLRTTVTKISPALDLRGEQLRLLHFTLADFARVLVLYKNEAASFLLRRDDEDDAPSVDFYVLVTAREPKQRKQSGAISLARFVGNSRKLLCWIGRAR